jgi:hypothetical protein
MAGVLAACSSSGHPGSLVEPNSDAGPFYDATYVPPVRDSGNQNPVDAPADVLHDVVSDTSADVMADAPSEACTTLCSGVCTDFRTDSKNCGGCSMACGTGQACVNGTCACTGGKTQCNGSCVDLTSDPNNCGFCLHNCQSPTCTMGLCPTTAIGTSDPGQTLADIAIDSTNVYWSWKALSGSTPTGGVSFKAFSGASSKTPAPFASGTGDIRGIFVDSLNLYATNYYAGSVLGSDLQGGLTTPVFYQPSSIPDAGIPSAQSPIDIVADPQNVYWVDYAGTVNQAPLGGGGPVLQLAGGRAHPIAIAVAGAYVYWIDYGTSSANTGSVNKVAIGADAGSITPLATGQNQPQDIATDGTNVYWTSRTNTGYVSKVSVSGGAVTVLAQNQGGPWAITVDQPNPDGGTSEAFVYWTNYNDNNVVKVPTTNTGPSAPFILASQQNNPVAIAVDRVAVYWGNRGDGTLWKVPK